MFGRKQETLRGDVLHRRQVSKSPATTVPQATCEGCKKRFTIELKERPLPGGGAQQRFRCPHCGKYYLVANISAEGIKIRQQLRVVEAQLASKPGDEALAVELQRLKGLMAAEVTKPR